MTAPQTVLVVEEHEYALGRIRQALEATGTMVVVAEARNGESALRCADEHRPHTVIVGCDVDDAIATDFVAQIRTVLPAARVVYVVAKSALAVMQNFASPPLTSASIELADDTSATRQAREFVRAQLESWHLGELISDAALVVSEMVTNAVLHARSRSKLVLRRTATGARIEVTDHDAGTPTPRPRSMDSVRGRGLQVVGAIAAGWGIDPTRTGKTVWADLAR